MKHILEMEKTDEVVLLTSDIVYGQQSFWCHASCSQQKLSLMRPRCHFPYDSREDHPLLIFLAGGSFLEVDRNVWMPELVYYAKHGYAVASIEYRTTMRTKFPDQIVDIKAAIRFLRRHAGEFHLRPDRVAIMGESAGAYFAGFAALTNGESDYDKGEFLSYPSTVDCVVSFYVPSTASSVKADPREQEIPFDAASYPALPSLVHKDSPPFLLFHGLDDNLVPSRESQALHDALESAGVPSELYFVKGAHHADHHFVQEQTKSIVLDFLNSHLL